jgi:hypothetical protein
MSPRKGAVILITLVFLISAQFPETGLCEENGWKYHSSFQISGILENISLEYPEVAEFTTSKDLLGTRDIPGGRTIPILFMGNRNEERPWIMLIGAHHGDEPDSAEAVLAFTTHIIDSYGSGDRRASEILDNINLAILPVVNPYGLDMNTREDENGEDPNRDYPFETAGTSGSTDGVPLTTAGAYTIHNLAGMYPFSIAISFHSGSKGIFYPWGAPNVGVESPDDVCFNAIGKELSRASGQDLLNGPANEFPYVANLEGAFDDHLYGSMFLMDRLYDQEMQLPWSVFTATVELDTVKGKIPGNMGSLDGLWDDPLSDQGTVPMGVRICYSACELVSPVMDVKHDYNGGLMDIKVTVSGAADLTSTNYILDGHVFPIEEEWTRHPFLPEWTLESKIEADLEEGFHTISLFTTPDKGWEDLSPDAYPMISPQSILAGSRKGMNLTWATVFKVENGSSNEQIPDGEVKITDDRPIRDVSWESTINLSLDWDESLPDELVIISRVDEWTGVTRYNGNQIRKGEREYAFEMVGLEGIANITINLSFPEGDIIEFTSIRIIPALKLISQRILEKGEDEWEFILGVEGGKEFVSVIWGISRDPDLPWYDPEWSIGPFVEISPGYGPIMVKVNLSGYDGVLYFRAVTSDNPHEEIETSVVEIPLIVEGSIEILPPVVTIINETIRIGPCLVISSMDGLRSLDKFANRVDFRITLSGIRGNHSSVDLRWMDLPWLDEQQAIDLDVMAAMNGLDVDEIDGAFFGEMELPDEEGEYILYMDAVGTVGLGQGEYSDFSENGIHGPIIVGDVSDGKGDQEKDFPWILFIFLIIVALLILIFTYFRYDSHWKEPEPGNEDPEQVSMRREQRIPIRQYHSGKPIDYRRRNRRGEPGARRPGHPPWR